MGASVVTTALFRVKVSEYVYGRWREIKNMKEEKAWPDVKVG